MTSRSPTTTEKASRKADSGSHRAALGGFALAPVHPGRILQRELAARGVSANALALKLRVAANRISEIIAGRRGISAETALRLGRHFGTGPVFWANLQTQYDLAIAQQKLGARIAAEVEDAA
ncbi:MAG: HigA family addiction module antidote protein [Bauldia sp.]|nr:HigA family addiction module antidote protein [Bauldia sp.]